LISPTIHECTSNFWQKQNNGTTGFPCSYALQAGTEALECQQVLQFLICRELSKKNNKKYIHEQLAVTKDSHLVGWDTATSYH
jgi:hypothetical protein